MAGRRMPGPLDQIERPHVCDDGTLVRGSTPRPGPLAADGDDAQRGAQRRPRRPVPQPPQPLPVQLWRVRLRSAGTEPEVIRGAALEAIPVEHPPDWVFPRPPVPTGLFVRDAAENRTFRPAIMDALERLMTRPVGRQIVTTVISGNVQVRIEPRAAPADARPLTFDFDELAAVADSSDAAVGQHPGGSGTTIYVASDIATVRLQVYDENHAAIEHPLFIALGHELIHAMHDAGGQNRARRMLLGNNGWDDWHNEEERQTIASGHPSENDLRAEHHLPLRRGHSGINPTRSPPRLPEVRVRRPL
jgi:Effector protein